MANQYLPYCEETTRGTKPGSPSYKFLPITKGLVPKFDPKDEPRKEFRGADTALGDSSVVRRESAYTISPECYLYPGAEVGTLLKHLLGKAATRTTVDTSAYKGILYPVAMPYGTGAVLADKAIGFEPNMDRDGTTASQYFGGARFKNATLTIKPGDDITLALEGGGAGGWIGAANQAATANPTFPAASPYAYADAAFYVGSGATRTGTAPDYTDLAPGTMSQIQPDEFTLKIPNGLEDKSVLNGVKGPSKTERTAQFMAEVEFTLDFRDPASGFSSIDEFEAQFSGPRTNSIMVVITGTELAGAATQKYQEVIDLPLVQITIESPEADNEGKTVKAKIKGKTLYSYTTKYPLAWLRVDKAATY